MGQRNTSLVTHEREKYEGMWSIPSYGENSPGEKLAKMFHDMVDSLDIRYPTAPSVLDAGCGSGKGAIELARLGWWDITLCDLTPEGLVEEARRLFPFMQACLWDDLRSGRDWDWVYCCDVLEHIPPTFVMLVVSRLLEVARKGVFLNISLMPDEFGAFSDGPLHQTVQPYPIWREQLSTIAVIHESRDLLSSGVFLLEGYDA